MARQHKLRQRRWEELADYLATIGDAAEIPDEPGLPEQQRILQERAYRLAQPSMRQNEPASEARYDVLGFLTGGEHLAFEACFVAKVLALEEITRLPGLPSYVTGIMQTEGEVISIVDLRSLLHLPVSQLAEPAAVIVLRNETNEFGVLADEITGMEQFHRETVQPGVAGVQDRESLLLGVTISRIGILDARRLLTDPRLIIDAN